MAVLACEMRKFSLFVLLINYFMCNHVRCIPRNFVSSHLCETDADGDCSFQVDNMEGICKVLNTSVCSQYDLDQWTTVPAVSLSTEHSAKFNITVSPSAGMSIPEQIYAVPALNISLNSFTKEINGFIINLFEFSSEPNGTICGIFDFRPVSLMKQKNFSLSYDCLHSLTMHGSESFILSVKALPLNEELQYIIKIPSAADIEPSELCSWKSVTLIYVQSLQNNIVSFKFSKAPSIFDVRGYEVTLHAIISEEEDKQIDTILLEPDSHDGMIHGQFCNVDIGYYFLKVTPLSQTKECEGFPSSVIFVPTEKQSNVIAYVAGISICGIILTIILLSLMRWMFRPNLFKPRKL